ncbi:flagellar biosynthetic protein FliO [Geothermobacter ehrlichii]|uniref:Flagellar biosynthetic protein FliO n=1 Tax=Geothermobacter ehrlichii TaxID=213224 RepID=A0A5D3WNR5_9BACT|nr:flagellar biosynthetic protein FliO [Geothermobacter ehrlichii]TYP00198.1 flagellar biosynthetic protein FliO [Geothermobacter ehrlichii]
MLRTFLFIGLLAQAWPVLAAENYSPPGLLTGGLRVVGSLVLVIGLALLVLALAKKRLQLLPGQKKGAIRVIETRALAPKKAVALIEVRGRELLVGIGQDSVSLLCELPTDKSFADALDRQLEVGE